MAQQATQLKAAPTQQEELEIHHWDCESFDASAPDNRFTSSVEDQRESHGQVFQRIRAVGAEEDRDLLLSVVTEINTLHGEPRPMPCVHVAIEDSNGTLSLFRSPDGLLLRLETGVHLSRILLPDGTSGYRLTSAS